MERLLIPGIKVGVQLGKEDGWGEHRVTARGSCRDNSVRVLGGGSGIPDSVTA